MQPLDKQLRNRLESTIKSARDTAEDAVRVALGQLGVAEAKPFPHLSDTDRELRRRLRVHGRQLGDRLDATTEGQQTERLVEEAAYEHWHRMLFARFLAENDLLMYPDADSSIPVTLEECEDLARDAGAANGWDLASRFAARMLPQIFRVDSPVFQIVLPPEHQRELEQLLANLSVEVFTASDSLGWVYQFWQTKKKDQINGSEVKIGARELPAVTQLFTEPYMVSFLLDNSLGAWWAARHLTDKDFKNAGSEEELRQKVSIPGVPLEYLRFVREENDSWTPAAGTFDSWPEHLSELKTLDPACGSGHFLVAAFQMLVPIRMEREGLSPRQAVDAVLQENIHGLDIDPRVTEIAAFGLALTAWRYPGAGGYRPLPELNVACSGLSISAKKEEWLALAGDNKNVRVALEGLYKQFKDAPVLGSLINPEASLGKGSLFELKWDEVGPVLTQALSEDGPIERAELTIAARGLSRAAVLLSRQYEWVITNVPYRVKADLTSSLQVYLSGMFPLGKPALETAFLERLSDFTSQAGNMSIVIMQNWLYLTSYTGLRRRFLQDHRWNLAAILGANAFEEISGEVVKVALLNVNKEQNNDDTLTGLDVSRFNDPSEKSEALVKGGLTLTEQSRQMRNPDQRIIFEEIEQESFLSEQVDSLQGLSTGDNFRVIRKFWEAGWLLGGSRYEQGSVSSSSHFRGREHVFFIDTIQAEGNALGSALRGKKAWGKAGVAVDRMGDLSPCIYSGDYFDINVAVLLPFVEDALPAVMSFCESDDFSRMVRILDKKAGVTNSTIGKIHFDREYWTTVASSNYPNGLPKPYTDDPTQWIFHGHPCGSVVWDEEQKWTAQGSLRTDHTVLQVAVARLLGYRWPAELETNMELADEQREWVKRCEALAGYADDDGIVCIPPVRGEASASDRLLNLLAGAYGDAWSIEVLSALLTSADHAGKTLETWLRVKFFSQHFKLFQHRPFIWHVWDGLNDGFAALINYHKFDSKLLQTLIYTYLGDWINRQKQDIAGGVDGSQERLAAAEVLKKRLELILEGEAPYDVFVRWKPLEQQSIGWDPDLNDGVRLNIRPFMTAEDVHKKGAGVLRERPGINWKKDRGKDVESAPWYHLGPQYGGNEGDRINDHHLTLEDKRNARTQKDN